MATLLPYFKLDKTGSSATNRKENERYTVANQGRSVRAFTLTMGCFYTDNVEIIDVETGNHLVPGKDFTFTEIYSSLSIVFGHEVAGTVLLTNAAIGHEVLVSYNFLGSDFKQTVSNIPAVINKTATERHISPLQWDMVNKSVPFIPTDYARQIGTGVGFETLVYGIEKIRSSILFQDFNIEASVGEYIAEFLSTINSILEQRIEDEYKDKLIEFRDSFTKELLGLANVVNLGVVDPETAKYAVIRNYQYVKNQDGYVTLRGLVRFKEELYNNLVSSDKTSIGKFYGTYGLPLLQTLYSMTNGASIIIDSLSAAKVLGYSFNEVVYPTKTSPNDKFSIVKMICNINGQGGVLWATNMNTGEFYVGKLKNESNAVDVLVWNKIFGEYDIQKAIDALDEHIRDFENPHRTTAHQIELGLLENLPLADQEDLACRAPADKYVSHKFLLAFMSTYMSGLKTAEDLKEMNCEGEEVIRNIKLLFAPCGPCGPCCEPNVIEVTKEPGNGTNVDPAGQLTGWYCENGKRIDIVTDGFGGTYDVEHRYEPGDPKIETDGCVNLNTSTTTTTTTTKPPTGLKYTVAGDFGDTVELGGRLYFLFMIEGLTDGLSVGWRVTGEGFDESYVTYDENVEDMLFFDKDTSSNYVGVTIKENAPATFKNIRMQMIDLDDESVLAVSNLITIDHPEETTSTTTTTTTSTTTTSTTTTTTTTTTEAPVEDATYSIVFNKTSLDPLEEIEFTITQDTGEVPYGETIWWDIEGDGFDEDMFTYVRPPYTYLIMTEGTVSNRMTLKNDYDIYGFNNFKIIVWNDDRSVKLCESSLVTVNYTRDEFSNLRAIGIESTTEYKQGMDSPVPSTQISFRPNVDSHFQHVGSTTRNNYIDSEFPPPVVDPQEFLDRAMAHIQLRPNINTDVLTPPVNYNNITFRYFDDDESSYGVTGEYLKYPDTIVDNIEMFKNRATLVNASDAVVTASVDPNGYLIFKLKKLPDEVSPGGSAKKILAAVEVNLGDGWRLLIGCRVMRTFYDITFDVYGSYPTQLTLY